MATRRSAASKNFDDVVEEFPPRVVDKSHEESRLNIRSAATFVSEFSPPEYLIEDVLQRGFLYTLTGPTGSGKTAVCLRLASHFERGKSLNGLEVLQGPVIYCAGENPDDVRQRFIVELEATGIDADACNIHFMTPRLNNGLLTGMDEITAYAERLGGVAAIFVDTAAAFFPGDDDNSNVAMGAYGRDLRRLCRVPGRPTVIVPAHPIKAVREKADCIPRGGGALLNEVDGNLSLWRPQGSDLSELHWTGKFRGADFAPVSFRLDKRPSSRVVDAKGRPLRSVVAVPVANSEAAVEQGLELRDESAVLSRLIEGQLKKPAEIARALNWHYGAQKAPHSTKVSRILQRLQQDGLARLLHANWEATPKGRAAYRLEKEGVSATNI